MPVQIPVKDFAPITVLMAARQKGWVNNNFFNTKQKPSGLKDRKIYAVIVPDREDLDADKIYAAFTWGIGGFHLIAHVTRKGDVTVSTRSFGQIALTRAEKIQLFKAALDNAYQRLSQGASPRRGGRFIEPQLRAYSWTKEVKKGKEKEWKSKAKRFIGTAFDKNFVQFINRHLGDGIRCCAKKTLH
jgi:hypothetical protein